MSTFAFKDKLRDRLIFQIDSYAKLHNTLLNDLIRVTHL